ncbi:DUF1850 domain-containing protein [Nitratireductor kimnyeongensis]|uniref:DUF1850 domain-containing protein n=1 Tax=Nitratireductor kimnyeongensis TaxID=430679 RepID=A0ABW0TCL2_9HYPH|nr:DUF1850 domain-containing protein [Nitratireductor kimnyeongensis]QZZ37181.1 DUF1850 domain-containing protein [Nitratireductor kimnyeongensis]
MSICVFAGGKALTLGTALFSLSWMHSVEKIRWEEDWRATPAGLEIVEARVQGSGAGMEPPPDARFDMGWWRYRPSVPPQPELVLAASGKTGSGWELCAAGECREIGATEGTPAIIKYCE